MFILYTKENLQLHKYFKLKIMELIKLSKKHKIIFDSFKAKNFYIIIRLTNKEN